MPHFRLMDADKMNPADALLLRAKLHVRGGRRRVSQNKIPAAIASLHDAFLSAMQRFFVSSELKELLQIPESDIDLYDDDFLFPVLMESGIIDDTFTKDDFQYLSLILDEALEQETKNFDKDLYFSKYDNIMTQLGVLPFSEKELPPEDPSTY
ncbi:MAG: hypothetical protein ACW99Q_25655 [Candidatus Kariarchaeaceae archaeon]